MVAECLEAMIEKSSTDNMHKVEKKSKILHDQIDRDILCKELEVSLDIFNVCQYADKLVNFVTE